jgi:hypothetical protein
MTWSHWMNKLPEPFRHHSRKGFLFETNKPDSGKTPDFYQMVKSETLHPFWYDFGRENNFLSGIAANAVLVASFL